MLCGWKRTHASLERGPLLIVPESGRWRCWFGAFGRVFLRMDMVADTMTARQSMVGAGHRLRASELEVLTSILGP